jgi:hypothetical protein
VSCFRGCAQVLVAAGWIVSLALGFSGCGGAKLEFHYPSEQVDFSLRSTATPKLFIDLVRDLRPAAQRAGGGVFFGVDYPADDAWRLPIVQIYRDALVQDLTQTNLVELVPLISQADFTLEIDILSFGGHLQRNVLNYVVPAAAGMGAGFALGGGASSGVKTGAGLAVVALLAVPTPTAHRAECEVRMTLRDRAGEVVWQRACLGERDGDVWLAATSRDQQGLVDKYLASAVKRCNACLLGQLRQALIAEGE